MTIYSLLNADRDGCMFVLSVLLVDFLVVGALFSSHARNEGGMQAERTGERSKDNLKQHSAPGQSSNVPAGKNHIPWELETRANTAALTELCVYTHREMYSHNVYLHM